MSELRRVSTHVPDEAAEEARAALIELFPTGFAEVEHAGAVEFAVYTDADGERRLRARLGAARSEAVAPGWEERWRDFHRPARVGPLWIGPPWHEPPPDALAIVIDPGRAFGTGAHPTTRLCLGLLLELEPGGLLDVGCGSGVLAIAAAKIGFHPVQALDVDPAAVEATAANAAANEVAVDARLRDAVAGPVEAETVVANISAAAVAAVAARADCDRLIGSGYLEAERLSLPRFRPVTRHVAEGWAADLLERQSE